RRRDGPSCGLRSEGRSTACPLLSQIGAATLIACPNSGKSLRRGWDGASKAQRRGHAFWRRWRKEEGRDRGAALGSICREEKRDALGRMRPLRCALVSRPGAVGSRTREADRPRLVLQINLRRARATATPIKNKEKGRARSAAQVQGGTPS